MIPCVEPSYALYGGPNHGPGFGQDLIVGMGTALSCTLESSYYEELDVDMSHLSAGALAEMEVFSVQ